MTTFTFKLRTMESNRQLYKLEVDFGIDDLQAIDDDIRTITKCLQGKSKIVEFHNSLKLIDDLEELGVASTYKGNIADSYMEFVSNGNLVADPVIKKYGIPRELSYTYTYEGMGWLTPTIIYQYSFDRVEEKLLNADLFYLKTAGDSSLNPYEPYFYENINDEIPLMWIALESFVFYIDTQLKVELEIALGKDIVLVDQETEFISSPEVDKKGINLGVNN